MLHQWIVQEKLRATDKLFAVEVASYDIIVAGLYRVNIKTEIKDRFFHACFFRIGYPGIVQDFKAIARSVGIADMVLLDYRVAEQISSDQFDLRG
jgi:hypothetical protein